jgi:hypothetical protein
MFRPTLTAAFGASFFIFAPVHAQTRVLACQYVAAGGLLWEFQNWRGTRFTLGAPFVLTAENGRLTRQSVAVAFGRPGRQIQCIDELLLGLNVVETCSDSSGNALFFDHSTSSGVVGRLFLQPNNRIETGDILSVEHFYCQRL